MKLEVLTLDGSYEVRDVFIKSSYVEDSYIVNKEGDGINSDGEVKLKASEIKELNLIKPRENGIIKCFAQKEKERVVLYGICFWLYANHKVDFFVMKSFIVELAVFERDHVKARYATDPIYDTRKDAEALFCFSTDIFLSNEDIGVQDAICLIKEICGEFFYTKAVLRTFESNLDIRHFLNYYCHADNSLIKWNLDNMAIHNLVWDEIPHNRFYYVQRVNEDAVIRMFHLCLHHEPFEYMRIRLSNQGVIIYRNYNFGWKEEDISKMEHFYGDYDCWFAGMDKGVLDTSYKYYYCYHKKNSSGGFNGRNLLISIIFPGIDNLLKLKRGEYFFDILCDKIDELDFYIDESVTFKKAFNEIFYGYNSRENSFAKMIGISQRMLDIILGVEHEYLATIIGRGIIADIKRLFTNDYLNHLDKDTFICLLKFYLERDRGKYCLETIVDSFGEQNIKDYINKLNSIKTINDIYTYQDYIHMITAIRNEYPQFKWNIPVDTETLNRFHDEAAYIYNLQKDSILVEEIQSKFDDIKGNWDQYIYSDDEFCIIPPSSPMDIIREGAALHHCVKSYLENVCDGETNILFLRKKDDKNTPFYTLEVKDGSIRQCHGFANCNITAELEDFLHRFCNEKNIIFSNGERVLAAG